MFPLAAHRAALAWMGLSWRTQFLTPRGKATLEARRKWHPGPALSRGLSRQPGRDRAGEARKPQDGDSSSRRRGESPAGSHGGHTKWALCGWGRPASAPSRPQPASQPRSPHPARFPGLGHTALAPCSELWPHVTTREVSKPRTFVFFRFSCRFEHFQGGKLEVEISL